jgi:hypothetical protein
VGIVAHSPSAEAFAHVAVEKDGCAHAGKLPASAGGLQAWQTLWERAMPAKRPKCKEHRMD